MWKDKDNDGLFKSIFTAYFILLLHVVLLAGVGVTIVLFKGLIEYLHWIMAGLAILVLAIAWIFYRRMKNSTSDIRSILATPEFRDRSVEIKLFGGMASFKVNASQGTQPRIAHTPEKDSDRFLIEHDINETEQKIIKLTALFEKDLISKEEFEKAKQNILQG